MISSNDKFLRLISPCKRTAVTLTACTHDAWRVPPAPPSRDRSATLATWASSTRLARPHTTSSPAQRGRRPSGRQACLERAAPHAGTLTKTHTASVPANPRGGAHQRQAVVPRARTRVCSLLPHAVVEADQLAAAAVRQQLRARAAPVGAAPDGPAAVASRTSQPWAWQCPGRAVAFPAGPGPDRLLALLGMRAVHAEVQGARDRAGTPGRARRQPPPTSIYSCSPAPRQ